MSSSGVLQEHLTQLGSVDLVNVALRSVVSGHGIRNPGSGALPRFIPSFLQHSVAPPCYAGNRPLRRRCRRRIAPALKQIIQTCFINQFS